jgi:hypothetical protein
MPEFDNDVHRLRGLFEKAHEIVCGHSSFISETRRALRTAEIDIIFLSGRVYRIPVTNLLEIERQVYSRAMISNHVVDLIACGMEDLPQKITEMDKVIPNIIYYEEVIQQNQIKQFIKDCYDWLETKYTIIF